MILTSIISLSNNMGRVGSKLGKITLACEQQIWKLKQQTQENSFCLHFGDWKL